MARASFEFKLHGLDELIDALEQLPTASMQKSAVRNAMKKALVPVADMYRDSLPWAPKSKRFAKSPHLRDSVAITSALKRGQRKHAMRATPASVVMHVGSTAPHAHLLEFGTVDQHHKKKIPIWLGGGFIKTDFVRRVTPRPFLRNAWDTNRARIIPIFAEVMKANLERAARNLARKAAKGTLTRQQREGLLRE